MRRIHKLGLAAPVALAIAGMSLGSASAASQPKLPTMSAWQAAIGQTPAVGSGCFHASFPTLVWHATTCVTAPERPLVPAQSASRQGSPETVGNGVDYSAVVSGLISKATGTFTNVSSKISEKGQIGGTGPQYANEFSLQLNTEFFTGVSGVPGEQGSVEVPGVAAVRLRHQLRRRRLHAVLADQLQCHAAPSGWFTYSTDCYTNSSASTCERLSAHRQKPRNTVALWQRQVWG